MSRPDLSAGQAARSCAEDEPASPAQVSPAPALPGNLTASQLQDLNDYLVLNPLKLVSSVQAMGYLSCIDASWRCYSVASTVSDVRVRIKDV